MIVRDESTGAMMHIKCEVDTCDERSPDIGVAHEGLVKKGWRCEGGRHWCPKHKDRRNG